MLKYYLRKLVKIGNLLIIKAMTRVKFLVDDEDRVFAYFPDLNYNKQMYGNGMKQGYAHIGQHTAISKEYAAECEPALFSQYADLYQELTGLGYNLNVLNK